MLEDRELGDAGTRKASRPSRPGTPSRAPLPTSRAARCIPRWSARPRCTRARMPASPRWRRDRASAVSGWGRCSGARAAAATAPTATPSASSASAKLAARPGANLLRLRAGGGVRQLRAVPPRATRAHGASPRAWRRRPAGCGASARSRLRWLQAHTAPGRGAALASLAWLERRGRRNRRVAGRASGVLDDIPHQVLDRRALLVGEVGDERVPG